MSDRVLIIEDDPEVAMFERTLLETGRLVGLAAPSGDTDGGTDTAGDEEFFLI